MGQLPHLHGLDDRGCQHLQCLSCIHQPHGSGMCGVSHTHDAMLGATEAEESIELPASISIHNLFPLALLVERAKKCLDFASTVYIVHIVACCAYGGFPRHLSWCASHRKLISARAHVCMRSNANPMFPPRCRWAVNLLALGITAVLGEWLCLQREMQDIPVTTTGTTGNPTGSRSAAIRRGPLHRLFIKFEQIPFVHG